MSEYRILRQQKIKMIVTCWYSS